MTTASHLATLAPQHTIRQRNSAVGSDNHGSWGLGMNAGTSPSIAALPGGGYEVAFQANTGKLWTVGSGDWKLGMMPGTSPTIAAA